ncbi:FecR domain-containing protein [Novispirillum sp. DQ9]|uniref:FecR family protein n=1 Tax=Novispirillum sp. DQ9 TaxID=3398612 RepID=UPI003C7DD896
MFRGLHILMVLGALVLGAPVPSALAAAGRPDAGTVTRAQGEVRAAHGGQGRLLAAGDTVYLEDTLLTGPEARVAVRLRDGSDVTLGGGGALTLDGLIVAPDGGPGDGFSVLAGAFRLIAAPTPGAEVRTPVATIGIRGTDFWGGPLDGALDVLTLEGRVAVTTAGGDVVLGAGQGTVVAGPGGAPGPATAWADDKVRRALDSVAFR